MKLSLLPIQEKSNNQSSQLIVIPEKSTKLSHVEIKHWDELTKGSGIPADLVELNIRSINGKEATDLIGTGKNVSSGWVQYCALNPESFLFKPDVPSIGKNGKSVKYLNAKDSKHHVMFPFIPVKLGNRLLKSWGDKVGTRKYDENLTSKSFWNTVAKDTSIPLVLTEGGKKAMACLATDRIAIAMKGQYSYLTPKAKRDGKTLAKDIHSDELAFIDFSGREVFIALDNDTVGSTAYPATRLAISKMAAHFSVLKARVRVVTWTGSKGIDDLLVDQGKDAVIDAFTNAQDDSESMDSYSRDLYAHYTKTDIQCRFQVY
ncbi:MAG: DUF3854 domain-containing protein [Pleurocapsa sp. CRU_1_2]|nr:DUF3854 domain-containing protein [Pleurocapsa sp. CRU_1_2]